MGERRRLSKLLPPDAPHVELLVGDELRILFSEGFDGTCLDPMGYDLRLGGEVRCVTRGLNKEMCNGEEIEIYPSESIIVKTEEVLNLPDNVYAIGSPKMKLLVQGLWAHGGKTDPGYNLSLNLGFQNVGSQPCKLKRGQKIFHLTFFRIHGKTVRRYTGRGPGFPDLQRSPLDNSADLNDKLLKNIQSIDGIKSYRICKQIIKLKGEMGRAQKIPIIGLSAILMFLSLQYWNVISGQVSFILTLLSSVVSIAAYVWAPLRKRIKKT